MKKKTISSLLFFMALFVVKGQNLVPNYSFEDTIQCVGSWEEFGGYVSDWTGNAPSYFTSVCNESLDSVPLNWWGYRYAHSGHAYSGIYMYVSDTCSTCPINNKNLRDYIQVKLYDSLKALATYYVTFYVSPSDTSWYYCSSIGAYFSDSALHYAGSVFQYVKSSLTPQIENNPVKNPLTIAKKWIKVSGSFVAQGGEKYIIIGNFNNDSTSSIIYKGEVSTTEPDAFYYIDDVIVSPDSNYADSLFSSVQNISAPPKEMVKIFPNPSNRKFSIEMQGNSEKAEIEIYNMLGEKIYGASINSTLGQINLISQPAGIYLYRVITEQGEPIATGKLIIQ